MTANYKLADLVVEISSVYDYVHEMCKDYRTDEPAKYFVRTTQEDCEEEQRISASNAVREGIAVKKYSDQYLETLAVYRKIAELFVEEDIILFHGSVISVDGEAFLFTAKSGTGKSTHTSNWRKVFGDRAVMVNDDKPLLKITDEGVFAYGTPWDGKHHRSTNMSAKLKAVCVLTRSENNHIEKTTLGSQYNIVLQQVYRIKDAAKMKKIFGLLDRMFRVTDIYRLGCNMDEESAVVAYNGMKGN